MKKSIITIILCFTLLAQLIIPAYTVTADFDQSQTEQISVQELPDNIKNIISNYDELSERSCNIDIGETLYDIAIPTETGDTEVTVFAVPIKYENEDGDFEFIDTSFAKLNVVEKLLKGYDYENAANDFSVLFSDKAEKGFEMDKAFSMAVQTEEKNVASAEIDTDENKDGRLTYDNVYGDGTYIEYININSGVKENIVLEKNIGKNRFDFVWASDTHYLKLSDDSTFIEIVCKETNETDYVFSPLYVYDSYTLAKEQQSQIENVDCTTSDEYCDDFVTVADTMAEIEADDYEKQSVADITQSNYVNRHNTYDCHYEIAENDNGEYTITAVVSEEFLNSPETVYPVIIDPSVTASSSESNIEDTYVNASSPDTNYGSWTYMCFGYNNGKRWGYVRFKTLPSEIEYGSRIGTASLSLKFRPGQTTSAEGKMGAITKKNWTEDSLTWNTRIAWSGYYATSDHNNCSYYRFDVTDLVKDWYRGDCPNYGIVFTYTNQTYNDYNSVYSSESSLSNAPSLRITYARVDKTTYYYNNNSQSNPNSSYNRTAAVGYAQKYATYDSTTVNDTPNYRSTKYSKGGILNDGEGSNCTNFVSQCLHEGNMAYIGSESTRTQMSSWFYDTKLSFYYASYTWGGATSFAKHWGHTPEGVGQQRAYMTVVYEDFWDVIFDWDYLIATLQPGDVIQYSYDGKELNHSVIITSVDKDNDVILYAQHTDNKKGVNFKKRMQEIMEEDLLIYGVVIHKISKK